MPGAEDGTGSLALTCDVAPKRPSDALRIVSPNLWSNRSNASDFAKAVAERVSPTYMTFSCGAGSPNPNEPKAGAGPVRCNGLLDCGLSTTVAPTGSRADDGFAVTFTSPSVAARHGRPTSAQGGGAAS